MALFASAQRWFVGPGGTDAVRIGSPDAQRLSIQREQTIMKSTLSRLVFSLLQCLGTAASAAVITFDPASVINVNSDPATYDEAGFRLSGPAVSFIPLDGIGSGTPASQGLFVFSNNTLTLTSLGGGMFNLIGFDFSAADPFGFGTDPDATLLVSGLFGAGALPQTQELFLNNTGTAFQPWMNLSAVNFSSSADFALDNITVQNVPEPSAMALVGVAVVGCCMPAGGQHVWRRNSQGRDATDSPERQRRRRTVPCDGTDMCERTVWERVLPIAGHRSSASVRGRSPRVSRA